MIMQDKHHDGVLVKQTLRVYFDASKKHRFTLALCFLTPVGVLLTSIIAPYISSHILATLAKGQQQSIKQFVLLAIVLLFGVLANRIGMTRLMLLQAETMADLHDLVFVRLHKRGARYYSNTISGKVISDAIDFVSSYSNLMNSLFITGLGFFVTIFFGLLIVWITSWQIGIFLTLFVSVIVVWTVKESMQRSRLRSQRLRASKALTAHLSDTLVNAVTVKTFSNTDYEIKRSRKLNHHLEKLRIHDWQWTTRSGNNRIALVVTMQLTLLLLLMYLSKSNPAILATGIFAFTYILTISNKLFDLNTMTRQVEEAFLQASPITSMLGEEIEVKDIPGANYLLVKQGSIKFKNVKFDYKESVKDDVIFEDLNLDIAPGERIGLVGPSGGGKSTFTRLLLRFEDIQDGEITIDEQNIANVTQSSLRKNIAYVPQEPLLFHRTLGENIRYGNIDASENEVRSVAKKAHAQDFIEKLPNGYETLVGERGVKLSGGQRQRVAIARAMLKNAHILVLDEATSALDSESEGLIQDALWKLMEGRTAIVIAHRLSTIQRMDRIIVMDNGKIVEQGSHKDLIQLKGRYADLWRHQSGGFLED
jgi:ATP-binding cassette subfamily B protein